jgi:hypothetical protein
MGSIWQSLAWMSLPLPLSGSDRCFIDPESNPFSEKEKQATMRRRFFVLALAMVLNNAAFGTGGTSREPEAETSLKQAGAMKIKLRIKDRVLTATLTNSKTTQDFVSLLPLTLTMDDLFDREEFGHLPRAISERGERTHNYKIGELAYWSPGPDVAIFYRHDGQSIPDPGIIVLGKIDSGVEALNVAGSVKVTFELASHSPDPADNVRPSSNALLPVPTWEDLRAVAPALARYTEGPLLGDLWKRPDVIAARSQHCYRVSLERAQSDDRDALPFQPGAR